MANTPTRGTTLKGPHPHVFLPLWRERAGLTQADVAGHLSVTDVTIHRWETGKAPVTVQNFLILSRLYNAETPGDLMFHPDETKVAADIKAAADVLVAMDDDDRRRWLDIGRRLAFREAS